MNTFLEILGAFIALVMPFVFAWILMGLMDSHYIRKLKRKLKK